MKLLTCLLFVFAAAMAIPQDINEFFGNKDPSQLKWAHAVNSKDLLDKALKDTSIDMIEADVEMGNLKAVSKLDDTNIPIMSHDGDDSDLSLEHFLELVKNQKDRKFGIKLDFKNIDAYKELPKFKINELEIPVILNADVVTGPGKAPKAAVKIDDMNIEGVLYSLGWTTGDFIEEEAEVPEKKVDAENKNEYTDFHVGLMKKYVQDNFNDYNITFPVRAMFLSRNVKVFENYLKNVKYTLTVWSGKDDDKYIKISELSKFLLDYKEKVFIDIPKSVEDAITKERNGGKSAMPMAATFLAFIAFATNYFK